VLKVSVGQQLRAGRLNHEVGLAEVTQLLPGAVQGRYVPGPALPRPAMKVLLLAVPRPKVLSRCIQHATALGYQKILLCRSYRVEKSHLDSSKLTTERLAADVMLGLEQGRLVHFPELQVYPLFKPFVEDRLTALVAGLVCYLAHPSALAPTSALKRRAESFCLAVGPEGGWIEYEVELLARHGFVAISAGNSPLRVESALSYLTGQLDLIHSA
jgi:16S rRNA (uracil1498-N3)-methyltransferase